MIILLDENFPLRFIPAFKKKGLHHNIFCLPTEGFTISKSSLA
jgi:hypothetical protein